MKHFLIKYRFQNGSPEDWHREIARFIAALDEDPALKEKISYRCFKAGDGSGYYHLASVAEDAATKTLQGRDFFRAYKEKTAVFSAGSVEPLPLDLVAETQVTA